MEKSSDQVSPFADVVDQLCKTLNCSGLAENLERVDHAREMLTKLQQTEALSPYLENPEPISPLKISQMLLKSSPPVELTGFSANDVVSSASNEAEAFGEEFDLEQCNDDLSTDNWLGFFKGFEILSEDQHLSINENKQCFEISHKTSETTLEAYLRGGIRCFMIDLFKGTALENQKLIYALMESELRISREYGFPITSALCAMLSPRCQYTGMLEPPDDVISLKKEDLITLTTNREFSLAGSRKKVFVNARYLIDDCRYGDFILVGPSIQLRIIEIDNGDLHCCVMASGNLKSRLPVRFPARCDRYRISAEELEDITFAREVGIYVLISHMPGTPSYLDDLQNTFRLLQFDNVRIGCRIVVNEIQDDGPDLQWVTERYDSFVMVISAQQQREKCQDYEQPIEQDVLRLTPKAVNFIHTVFQLKKPIIMVPTPINDLQLSVCPSNVAEVFFCPDKYMFRCQYTRNTFYFYYLQNAHFTQIVRDAFTTMPYCDESHTGSDSLARSCVAASFESRAAAILVCSIIPDMCIKLSHFRPMAPIIYISSLNSPGDYISMYHNIVHLYFRMQCSPETHKDYVTKSLLFGLLFLESRRMVGKFQNVILVYGSQGGTKLPDKYVIYEFDEKLFPNHLSQVLFK